MILVSTGISLPDTIDNKHLEEMEMTDANQGMVRESYMLLITSDIYFFMLIKAAGGESTEVHYHRDAFRQLGRRLSEIEQLLKTSSDSQVLLKEDLSNLVSELTKLGKEVWKLAQERDRTESELKRKEHDVQLLSEMRKDLHSVEICQLLQEKCQLLQEMTNDKKKEIRRLEEELKLKEHKLQCVQHEAQAVKDKLSKLQAELEEKHEEVKNLQKEKKELAVLYDAKKEEAKKLVQITLSDRDEMEVCGTDNLFFLRKLMYSMYNCDPSCVWLIFSL